MSDQNIINELLGLELYAKNVEASAKGLRKLATGLRERLEGISSSTAPKGLTEDQISRLLGRRMKTMIKKQKMA